VYSDSERLWSAVLGREQSELPAPRSPYRVALPPPLPQLIRHSDDYWAKVEIRAKTDLSLPWHSSRPAARAG
jgi:hypothetical protein